MIKIWFEHKITIAYLLLGGFWIFFSDKLLYYMIPDAHLLSDIQTYKGLFYVASTALLFFFFIKRHLRKLRSAEKRAQESDRLKSAFLANLSHEIRTPMNGILGFSELLKDPKLTGEQQKEYIEVIEQSSARILTLFADLIILSKVDSNQIEINKTQVDINELFDFTQKVFMLEADKKGLSLVVSKPTHSDNLIVETDREKLFAILSHLVKNAIKYTSVGFVEFWVYK